MSNLPLCSGTFKTLFSRFPPPSAFHCSASSGTFKPTELLIENTTTLTTNGSTTPSMSQKVPIIHGDEFFMPKHLCPLVTFTSTPNDTEFCQASLRHDEIGQYFISWNGTRANDKFMTYTSVPGVVDTTITTDDTPKLEGRAPSNESFMTTFSVASTLHEGGKVKAFTISDRIRIVMRRLTLLGCLRR